MPPDVSICIATYERGKLLRGTLASIFSQKPKRSIEVIVVDDGSNDGGKTRRVCLGFPGIKYVRIDRPPGIRNPCTARNVAYRLAQGKIVICQSDEVLHQSPNCIDTLAGYLAPGSFVIATVYPLDRLSRVCGYFTGLKRQEPFFFLGCLYRQDLYAVGGNDEDFNIGTAYEDAWFGKCLIHGLKLTPTFPEDVIGHHQWHEIRNTPAMDEPAKLLYAEKVRRAEAGEIPWQSASGPWPTTTDVEKIFTEIYHSWSFGGTESRSGSGSNLDATIRIRKALPDLCQRYGIKTLLDLPCGDMYWMGQTELPGVERYIGADIVPDLLEANDKGHSRHDRTFLQLDVIQDDLPYADMILCRDALVHLSPSDVLRAIDNLHCAGIKYLLATTFPGHPENRTIMTGEWASYNLQAPPFNFPEPLELVNEDCQESYPTYADKSLALWRVDDLPGRSVRSLVVCVDYGDFLAVTLPRNKRHFAETLVVTAPHDEETIGIALESGCLVLVTEAFYRHGASFNKGAAIEEGFDALGRQGWICIWDADILMPSSIQFQKDRSMLYTPIRRILADPRQCKDLAQKDWAQLVSPTPPNEFAGYFQLFHAESAGPRPWYDLRWMHAGGGDSSFEQKYLESKKARPPFEVLHLGPEGDPSEDRIGKNWMGRTTPRIDGKPNPTLSPLAPRGTAQMVEMRHRYGTARETLPLAPGERVKIPKVMHLFWSGRMSWLRYLTVASFRKLNPSWQIVVGIPSSAPAQKQWKSPEDDDHEYLGPDYTRDLYRLGAEVRSWEPPAQNLAAAHMCDIYQWETLWREGGFYADMDILWLRPMEELYQSVKMQDVVFCLESGMLAIGFFGASPGFRLFRDLAADLGQDKTARYQGYGTEALYALAGKHGGSSPGIRAIAAFRKRYRGSLISVVPDEIVYPFDWRKIQCIFEEDRPIPSRTLGIHWFGGDPLAKRWNNLLAPGQWQEYHSTLTAGIKMLEETP